MTAADALQWAMVFLVFSFGVFVLALSVSFASIFWKKK